jgi:hypothetical protein
VAVTERDLRNHGYDAFAVDLAAVGQTGLPAYADAVVDAIDGRSDIALVAQSMGAFTAPLVWQRVPTRLVVFVNAMIPRPGETPGEWWDNVGSEETRKAAAARDGYSAELDLATCFMHDIPEDLAEQMRQQAESQLDERFDDVCTFDTWPSVPIHVAAGVRTGSSRWNSSNVSPEYASVSTRSSCLVVTSPRSAIPKSSPPPSPDTTIAPEPKLSNGEPRTSAISH